MKAAKNMKWVINFRFSIRCMLYCNLGILAYATFYGDMEMLKEFEFYFEQLKNIP